jgi:hypothetical protein
MIGHDNSNSDAFTISDGNGFASGTKFTMLSSGYVGIGTTSPIRMLDIRDASGDPGIRLESAAQSADVITLRNADGRVGFGRDAITTTTTSMVGVANTSPLVPFNVGGNSAGINFDYMPSWNSYFIGANVKRSTTNGRMVRVASSTSRYPVAIAFGYQDVAGFGSEDSKGGINFITVGSNISGDIDPDTYSRMYIAGDGDIGIGDTTPSYKLDVAGTIRATADVIAYSDERVKDNIETIENPLEKVKELRGVSYNRNDIEDKSKKIGVIAQEVEKVLPEVVEQDDEGKYSVAYGNMVGLLIESVKEQQKQIEELKSEIQELKNGSSK